MSRSPGMPEFSRTRPGRSATRSTRVVRSVSRAAGDAGERGGAVECPRAAGAAARGGILDGSITVLVRRWRRPQAVAGHTYRTAAGRIAVDEVAVVDPSILTDADAGPAGCRTADEFRADLRGRPGDPVYLLRVRLVDGPDPRTELAATTDLTDAEVAELDWRRPAGSARAGRPVDGVRARRHPGGARPPRRRPGRRRRPRDAALQGRCPEAHGARTDDQPAGRLPALPRAEIYPSRSSRTLVYLPPDNGMA